MGPGPGTKDLKDQSGTVNDLTLKLLLEIALLHRRERGIDDNDIDFQPLDRSRQPFNGPATQIGRRPDFGQRNGPLLAPGVLPMHAPVIQDQEHLLPVSAQIIEPAETA